MFLTSLIFLFLSYPVFSQIEISFEEEFSFGKQEESAHLFFFDDYFISISYAIDDSIPEAPDSVNTRFVFRKLDFDGNVIWEKNYVHDRIRKLRSNEFGFIFLKVLFYKDQFILFTEGNQEDRSYCKSLYYAESISIYYFDKNCDFISKENECFGVSSYIRNMKKIGDKVLFVGLVYTSPVRFPTIISYDLVTREFEHRFYPVPGIINDIIPSDDGYEFIGVKYFKQYLNVCGPNHLMGNNWLGKVGYDLKLESSREFKYINKIEPMRFEKLGDNDYLIFLRNRESFYNGFYRYKDNKLVFTNIDRLDNRFLNYFIDEDIIYVVDYSYYPFKMQLSANKNEKRLWRTTILEDKTDNASIYKKDGFYYLVSNKNYLDKETHYAKITMIIKKFKIK